MLNELKSLYEKLTQTEDSDDYIFEFKELLLNSDEAEILEFHFNILSIRKNEYLYRDIFSFFSERINKKIVAEFLYQKYINGIPDDILRADVIQILGHLRSEYGYILAIENMHSTIRDIRYRCIIVLGWLGKAKDLIILNERMINDPDGELRGFSATAMRQIWNNYKNTKEIITRFINNALRKEENDKAIANMVITLQDLHKKKLGIKESEYGDVSGDITQAKKKSISILDKMLKDNSL